MRNNSDFQNFVPKILNFRLRKSEKLEISLQNRIFHAKKRKFLAKIAQKPIVFERGELKYRVSERGKNVPGPEFQSAFNAAVSRF